MSDLETKRSTENALKAFATQPLNPARSQSWRHASQYTRVNP